MSQNQTGRVITYVPQYEADGHLEEMGTIRRGLYLYTNRLGLNYSLVLGMSLAYQLAVALFIGIRAIRNLPVLTWIPTDSVPLQVVAMLAAIVAGLFIQGLLIAEAAQVVWLRRTDRLKTRLEKDSGWWWVMLFVLVVTLAGDFILVFLAIIGTTDPGPAWAAARVASEHFLGKKQRLLGFSQTMAYSSVYGLFYLICSRYRAQSYSFTILCYLELVFSIHVKVFKTARPNVF